MPLPSLPQQSTWHDEAIAQNPQSPPEDGKLQMALGQALHACFPDIQLLTFTTAFVNLDKDYVVDQSGTVRDRSVGVRRVVIQGNGLHQLLPCAPWIQAADFEHIHRHHLEKLLALSESRYIDPAKMVVRSELEPYLPTFQFGWEQALVAHLSVMLQAGQLDQATPPSSRAASGPRL